MAATNQEVSQRVKFWKDSKRRYRLPEFVGHSGEILSEISSSWKQHRITGIKKDSLKCFQRIFQ